MPGSEDRQFRGCTPAQAAGSGAGRQCLGHVRPRVQECHSAGSPAVSQAAMQQSGQLREGAL
eukprot:1916438-Prorocentrum_lima.AAC.1